MNKKIIFKVTAFPVGNKVYILHNHTVIRGVVDSITIVKNEDGEVIPKGYRVTFKDHTKEVLTRGYAAEHVFPTKRALTDSL